MINPVRLPHIFIQIDFLKPILGTFSLFPIILTTCQSTSLILCIFWNFCLFNLSICPVWKNFGKHKSIGWAIKDLWITTVMNAGVTPLKAVQICTGSIVPFGSVQYNSCFPTNKFKSQCTGFGYYFTTPCIQKKERCIVKDRLRDNKLERKKFHTKANGDH